MRGWRCGLVAWVLLLGPACGGGGGEASEPAAAGPPPATAPGPAEPTADEALCERLVECAVEEARARMTPEEVAQLDVEDTGARLRDKCEGEGATSTLSPRQIRVVQRCVNQQGTCEELHTCVQEAKKQSK